MLTKPPNLPGLAALLAAVFIGARSGLEDLTLVARKVETIVCLRQVGVGLTIRATRKKANNSVSPTDFVGEVGAGGQLRVRSPGFSRFGGGTAKRWDSKKKPFVAALERMRSGRALSRMKRLSTI